MEIIVMGLAMGHQGLEVDHTPACQSGRACHTPEDERLLSPLQ